MDYLHIARCDHLIDVCAWLITPNEIQGGVGGNEQVGSNEDTNVAGVEAVMVVADAGARIAEAWAGGEIGRDDDNGVGEAVVVV